MLRKSRTAVAKMPAIGGIEGPIPAQHLDGTRAKCAFDGLEFVTHHGEHTLNSIEPGTEACVLRFKRCSPCI